MKWLLSSCGCIFRFWSTQDCNLIRVTVSPSWFQGGRISILVWLMSIVLITQHFHWPLMITPKIRRIERLIFFSPSLSQNSLGLLAPTLVQFEQEIDKELEKEQQQKEEQQNDCLYDSTPQQQITNNDLESLHEKVIRTRGVASFNLSFFARKGGQPAVTMHLSHSVLFGASLRGQIPNWWHQNPYICSGKCDAWGLLNYWHWPETGLTHHRRLIPGDSLTLRVINTITVALFGH